MMMSAKFICLLLIVVVFSKTEARLRRPGIMKSGKPSTALAEALDLDASYTWNYCQVASLCVGLCEEAQPEQNKRNFQHRCETEASIQERTCHEKRSSKCHHKKSSININEDTFQKKNLDRKFLLENKPVNQR